MNITNNSQLLNNTIEKIKQLEESRLQSVNDFVEFLLSKTQDALFTAGIVKLAEQSKAFHFLNKEPDIYSDADLIENSK